MSDPGLELTYACSPPPGVARVDVVLACSGGAAALPGVLARVPVEYRAIVVDTGSGDGSADAAAAHGATVVHGPAPGCGAAWAAGLAAATAPVVALADAGGGLDAAELPLVAEPVVRGSVDLVVGRPAAARAPRPWPARLLDAALRRRPHDAVPVLAGRREALLGLGAADRPSDDPLEVVAAAADAGWRVAEVPVARAPRTRRGAGRGQARVSGRSG